MWDAFIGRRPELFTLGAVLGVVALAAPLAQHPNSTIAAFVPAALVLTALLDMASFALLLEPESSEDHRARVILALTLLAAGLFAVMSLALVAPVTGVAALVSAPAQFAPWLYGLGHAYVGIAAFGYAYVRSGGERSNSARFTSAGIAFAVLLFAVVVVVANVGARQGPPIVVGTSFVPDVARSGLVFAALVCLAGCVRVAALREISAVERSFAFLLFAMTIDIALVYVAGHRYTIGWAASRLVLLIGSATVFSAVSRKLLRVHQRLHDAENALLQAGRRAARIRALWHVASSDALSDVEHAQTVLDAGRTALRVDHPIFGVISRIENDEVVIDAISWAGDAETHRAALSIFRPQTRFALEQSIASELVSIRTRFWNDLNERTWPSALIRQARWTNLIAATFQIGRVTHLLIFGTAEPLTSEPFAEDDVAFVDVLASQLSHRYYEREQLARLRYQMEHDALTGLCNRTEFRKALREKIAAGNAFGVALVDLDGFRFINETSGHLIGDEILVEVAATLSALEPDDIVARLAGDDFGIVMTDVDGEGALPARLQRYAGVFDKPFHTGDREGKRFLPVAASIGAAVFPDDGKSADDILRSADVALEAAKQRGGGTTVLYAEPLAAQRSDRSRFRSELLTAFDTDAFVLEYQPTFDLQQRRTAGAEALVRWDHPERGRLLPQDFVPFAERAGLGGRLARWVLGRVCSDLSRLALPDTFRCYFNLPAHLLDDPAFLSELETQISSVPRLARHLGIEITESEAMQNAERTVQALRNIREFGLQVAIDDFGTGYSSMAYLKRFPIDVVKIDRSFVSGLPDDEKDAALDEMFLQLTRQFGFVSLAEGIETEGQAGWLRDHGCMLGQGFLVSQPLPIEAFAKHVDALTKLEVPRSDRRLH